MTRGSAIGTRYTNPRTAAIGAMPATFSIDSTKATALVQKQYVRLSQVGRAMAAKAKAEGKAPPCEMIALYHAAVRNYFLLATQVIDGLNKRGMKMAQVVLDDEGNPKVDAADPDKVFVRYIDAPLRPPTFVTRTGQCKDYPGMTHLSGPQPAALGVLGPVVAVGGRVGMTLIKAVPSIAKWTVVAWAVNKFVPSAERIALSISGYNPTPAEKLDCFERIIRDRPDITNEQAMKVCKGEGGGIGVLGWLGIVMGAGLVVGGGVYYYTKLRPKWAAERAVREAAREEAEILEQRAKAVRKRGRGNRDKRSSDEVIDAEYYPPGVPAMAGSDDKLAGCPCAL